MSEAPAKTKHPAGPVRWIVGGVLAIIILSVGGGVAQRLLGDDETTDGTSASKKASVDTIVSTLNCNPDEKLWEATGGWCASPVLEPGQYRIKLKGWSYKLAIYNDEKTKVVDSIVVPEEGLSLSRWQGQPFEEQFKNEALLATYPKLAAPIYRIDGEVANPMTKGKFTLSEPGVIKVGINVIPAVNNFRGNTGSGMVVEIHRLGD
ncbi:MAG: hypothetical protein AAB845_00415 [Patescibacteria group bacterium]